MLVAFMLRLKFRLTKSAVKLALFNRPLVLLKTDPIGVKVSVPNDGGSEVTRRQHAEDGGRDDRPEEEGGTDRQSKRREVKEEDRGVDPATRAHIRRESEESGPHSHRDRAGSGLPGVPPVRSPGSTR